MIERALSIRQPWAWAILNAGKDVENRTWGLSWRGEFYIHAAKTCGKKEFVDAALSMANLGLLPNHWPGRDALEFGGIVGVARLIDCRLNRADEPKSPWEVPGSFSFVLADVRPVAFVPCVGAQGFWRVPADVLAKIAVAA